MLRPQNGYARALRGVTCYVAWRGRSQVMQAQLRVRRRLQKRREVSMRDQAAESAKAVEAMRAR